MSLGHGSNAIRSGLVLHLDAANVKSFQNYNIATYSQNFDNAVWNKSPGLISATGVLAPDNTLTAFTVTDDLTDAYENFNRSFTVPNDSSTYNISIFVKKTTGGISSRTGFNVNLTGGTTVNTQPRFNADTGVLVASNNMVVTSENNSYWRISFTITNNSTGNTNLSIQYYPATGPYNSSDLITATGSHTVWGFQLSLGVTRLSYRQNILDSTTIWKDLSQNTLDATLVNAPIFSENNKGYITFNGTNQSASFISSASIQFLGTLPYSLNAWVYLNSLPGVNTYSGVFNRESTFNSTRDGYSCWINTESGSTTMRIGTERFGGGSQTGIAVTYNTSDLLNKWINISTTYNSSTIALYFNGVLAGSTTSAASISNTTKNLEIGTRNGGAFFPGNIALSSVYNVALTAAEVRQNFESTRGRYGI